MTPHTSASAMYLAGARARLRALQQSVDDVTHAKDIAERAIAEFELALVMLEATEQEARLESSSSGMSPGAAHAWLELLDEAAFHQRILEHVPAAVLTLDRVGRVTWDNGGLAHVLHVRHLEGDVLDGVHPGDHDAAQQMLRQLQTSGTAETAAARVRLRMTTGEWRLLDVIGVNTGSGPLGRILTGIPRADT